MAAPEPRCQRVAGALAGRLDPAQLADLLWMAQLLASDVCLKPEAVGAAAGTAEDDARPKPEPADQGAAPHDQEQTAAPSSSPLRKTAPVPPVALVKPATGVGPLPAGTPRVAVADAGLLQRQRRIGRALAPLHRQVEAGPATVLDLRATVEVVARARADQRLWRPVLRPPRQPWLGLHLVFDGHPSMALWHKLRRELPRALGQQVRWRDLRRWTFRGSSAGGPVELLAAHGRRVAAGQRLPPHGRDLVLVVSDALAGGWRDGSVASLLSRWAGEQPVVLLQVLPSRLWQRTGLGKLKSGWVEARRELEPNASLLWRPLDTDPFWLDQTPAPPPADVFTLPLTSLDPGDLSAMARWLVRPRRSLRAVRIDLPAEAAAASIPAGGPAPEATLESEAIDQLVAHFLYVASPQARRLMGLLTFAPVITLPVVRLIQRQQIPDSGPAQIAEVLFSGLFRNDAPLDQANSLPVDRQQLCLVADDLRPRLRQGLRVGEARAVFDAVSEHVAESLNLSLEAFEALLCKPEALDDREMQPVLQAFATVSLKCLRGLGQGYEDFANAIEAAGWDQLIPGIVDPLFANLEPLPYETAWLEEIALQPITFTTSVLDEQLRQRDRQGQGWALREPLGADGRLGLTMVQIPAGSFLMGSPPDESGRFDSEGPQHEVTLQAFLISQTPITQAQWREVAGWEPPEGEEWGLPLDPYPSNFTGDDRPMYQVSWFEAMEFCRRLSQRTGRNYTLPSEAQWEYACRAGTTTPFHFGDTISPELANYNGHYTYANGPKGAFRVETTPVETFPANAWGLQDMHGNVWEWCLDERHSSYEGAPTDGSAWLDRVDSEDKDKRTKIRLLRGGSWKDDPRYCRSAYRISTRPDIRDSSFGFRVCCLPQDSASLPLNP